MVCKIIIATSAYTWVKLTTNIIISISNIDSDTVHWNIRLLAGDYNMIKVKFSGSTNLDKILKK